MNAKRWDFETNLDAPLRWRKPRKLVPVDDPFSDHLTDEQIAAVFGVMAATPQHTYQILTRWAERMARWFEWIADPSRGARLRPGGAAEACFWEAHELIPAPSGYAEDIHPGLSTAQPPWPLRNVWLGVSVEDKQRADERIHYLKSIPAAARFLSLEPLIAPFHSIDLDGIDLVTVGGESGPGARPCDVSWIRSIVRQCRAACVPVFVKQLGAHVIANSIYDLCPDVLRWWDSEHAGEPFPERGVRVHLRDRKGADPSEWPEDLRVREWPEVKP